MKSVCINLFLLLLFPLSLLNAKDTAYQTNIKQLKTEIETAYYSFDTKLLYALIKKAQNLNKEKPEDWIPDYYCGILNYVIGKVIYEPEPDKAYNCFKESLNYFDKVKDKNDVSEIRAMISANYGKLASLSTIKALYYGLKAKNYIYDAYNMDKNNSKVFLVAATHLMHIPEEFGGDKEKSRKFLMHCLEINKKRKKDEVYIDWALNAEIYAYLAQLELLQGKKQEGLNWCQKALEILPNYSFIKFGLLPKFAHLK